MTVEAASPAGTSVTFAQPTASDRLDGPVAARCDHSSGATFPLGTTKVICSAVDGHGNQGTATFTVIVRDTTPPTVGSHDNVVVNVGTNVKSEIVTFEPPIAQDAVDTGVTSSCSPLSGSSFPDGDTTVSCTATDASGNQSEPSKFTVSVEATLIP
jgi:hypothetical protein